MGWESFFQEHGLLVVLLLIPFVMYVVRVVDARVVCVV
jgi:hypothetical protein